jgi:hypothetical protein
MYHTTTHQPVAETFTNSLSGISGTTGSLRLSPTIASVNGPSARLHNASTRDDGWMRPRAQSKLVLLSCLALLSKRP